MTSGRHGQYRSSALKQATLRPTGSCRSKQATEATERERRLGRQTMMAAELETVGSMEQTEACPDSSEWESGLEWESGY